MSKRERLFIITEPSSPLYDQGLNIKAPTGPGETRAVKAKPRLVKGDLDTYELGAMIGEGAFCKVYSARGRETGEEVYMKRKLHICIQTVDGMDVRGRL